jgi:hypothetical protein
MMFSNEHNKALNIVNMGRHQISQNELMGAGVGVCWFFAKDMLQLLGAWQFPLLSGWLLPPYTSQHHSAFTSMHLLWVDQQPCQQATVVQGNSLFVFDLFAAHTEGMCCCHF